MSTQPHPTETIDTLLEHYLALLDEYTALRAALNTLQAAMYQSLARANFSAERGVRHYGRDYYDARMQALRRVRSGGGGGGGGAPVVVFTVGGPSPGGKEAATAATDEAEPMAEKEAASVGGDGDDDEKQKEERSEEESGTDNDNDNAEKKPQPVDPLRWFGILTPPALRQVQGQAIKAVEDIIPRLATLSAEMAGVELEVRRARKRRAKAERAEEKRIVELEDKMGEVNVSV
ncbi:hypothetical protein C8A00DRAFT_41404 [Chaetomidium leptoderma]|uniref:Vacuolar ATPase assembly protein VMA22 n=1 Tax=Chaetomidium leptoderma TaxID=669021 RepID=A0AAN6ZZ04_9PEZI|nr:hypothetical protein C8A00DRAFT_41404 [Chaetomidium leptoderma]